MPSMNMTPVTVTGSSLWNGGNVSYVQTNDGDTTYHYTLDNFGRGTTCSHASLPGTATSVTSCIDYAVVRYTGGSSPLYRVTGPSGYSQAAPAGSYTSYSYNSGTPTIAAVNSTDLSFNLWITSGETRCTYNYRAVSYLEGGGSFVVFWSWIGPVLGAALQVSDFLRAGEYCRGIWRNGAQIIYTPDELRALWREYRAYTFPTYVEVIRG